MTNLTALFSVVVTLLAGATLVGWTLNRIRPSATVSNLVRRIWAWWGMVAVLALATWLGKPGVTILFLLLSFLALREYLTLVPTARADHATLLWSFFIVTPVQYSFLWFDAYGMFSIFIPVYVFLFLPIRAALEGDTRNFLERTSRTQWGLMTCVYCLSHAPALLILNIPNFGGGQITLLVYLLLVVESSDVFQYIWGKLLGRRKIAPKISPNKTLAGLVGGVLSATALGTALYKVTPFSPLTAAALSLVATLLGFAGGLVMSAVKRDRGVKDYGNLIAGHGGALDRLDSLIFAAPVFFHLTRFFYSVH